MIFLIADVHTERKRLDTHVSKIEKDIGRALDERDTIVCLGDLFGKPSRKAPSLAKKIQYDRKFVDYIDTLPFRILCVHGNHDNAKRVWRIGAEESEVFGQHAMQMGKNIFYLDDGQVYELPTDATDEDGEHITALILGGSFGHLYRVHRAPVMSRLAFRQRYQHLINLVEPLSVDYVLAHDAPTSRLGKIVRMAFGKTEATDVLDAVEDNLVFHGWYYGHHHLDCNTTRHHHCLYRREIALTSPREDEKPFNWRYLAELDDDGDDVNDSDGNNDSDADVGPTKSELVESLAAVNTAITPEDKMTSGGNAVPYVPSDAEIDGIERQIEETETEEPAPLAEEEREDDCEDEAS